MGVLHAVSIFIHILSQPRQVPEERKTVTELKITREQVYREEAVRRVAGKIMGAELSTLDYGTVDALVRDEYRQYGQADTRIAFVDQIVENMRMGHWHGGADHITWFTSRFVGSPEPATVS